MAPSACFDTETRLAHENHEEAHEGLDNALPSLIRTFTATQESRP
ncbi:hypothetical protein [Streptomyces goshikiensis]